jgi:hypothetical protein
MFGRGALLCAREEFAERCIERRCDRENRFDGEIAAFLDALEHA